MKKLLFLGLSAFSVTLIANTELLEKIKLKNGESVVVSNIQVSCESKPTPTPDLSSSMPSKSFSLSGNHYTITATDFHAIVTNSKGGEKLDLGNDFIKTPEAIIFKGEVYFIGIKTGGDIYYRVGMDSTSWRRTPRGQIRGDYFTVISENSFMLFSNGQDDRFYMAEFSDGYLLNNSWTPLGGRGARIVSVNALAGNDFKITVLGYDGHGGHYERTRFSGFEIVPKQ